MAIDPGDPRDPLHLALRELTPPRAPRTLLPRVMATIAAAERLRNQRAAQPGVVWPLEWRVGSIAAMVAIAALAAWVWPIAYAVTSAMLANGIAAVEARLTALAPGATAMTHLAGVVWGTFFQPVVGFVVTWIVVMCAACAALAAALERVALGEVSQ